MRRSERACKSSRLRQHTSAANSAPDYGNTEPLMLLRPCQFTDIGASRSIAGAGAKDAFGDRGLRSGQLSL